MIDKILNALEALDEFEECKGRVGAWTFQVYEYDGKRFYQFAREEAVEDDLPWTGPAD